MPCLAEKPSKALHCTARCGMTQCELALVCFHLALKHICGDLRAALALACQAYVLCRLAGNTTVGLS